YGCFPRVGNRDLNPSRGEGSGLAMVRTCATLELGPVAQRLEQQTHNLLVAGSNPAGPTTVAHRSFAAAQLRISARGSNAAKAPQVQILPGPPLSLTGPSPLRSSGFRLAAQTPRKRLKFKSCRAHHCRSQVLRRCAAQDFGSRLKRRESASSSNPAGPNKL